MFAEPYTARQQPVTRPPDDSRTRWGTGFRPAWISSTPEYSPLLSYPYHAARAALERVATNDGGSPFDGVLMEYMNPLTGGSVLPTMDAYLQRVPAATVLATHRHTSATVYLGVEGSGIVDIDGEPYPWEPNDVIVVPSWASHRHRNPGREAAVLFSFSNAPLLKKMGLYREEAVSDAP
jgi:gentisate 1,2-dioxygenase